MNRRSFVATSALLPIGAVKTAPKSPAVAQAAVRPWPVRGSVAFELESKSVGDTFAIGVWQPDAAIVKARGAAAADGFDLVYVLDGSWGLNVAASVARQQLVDFLRPGFRLPLLVGIDYPEGRPNARTRDYTMADDGSADHPSLRDILKFGSTPAVTLGGADRFLHFLETELDPLIRARYPVASRPAGILGHSYGGQFTAYAFLKQSRLFNRFWLGSPGLFTSKADWVGQLERVAVGQLVHDTRMFLSFGEVEAFGGAPFYEDMGRNFGRFSNWLARHPNPQLQYRAKLYPGHTHTSVMTGSMADALLFLYGSHFPG